MATILESQYYNSYTTTALRDTDFKFAVKMDKALEN
jgi:hypothetical protein